MDSNDNGELSRKEFNVSYESFKRELKAEKRKQRKSGKWVDDLFEKYDSDDSGSVTMEEVNKSLGIK